MRSLLDVTARALFAPEFVFGCPRDGDKANRSRAIFEHQSYLSVVHDSACEVAVGFRYASLHGSLVIAGELALFHPGDTDESDHAVGVFKYQPSADRICNNGGEISVRLRDRSVFLMSSLSEDRIVRACYISGYKSEILRLQRKEFAFA